MLNTTYYYVVHGKSSSPYTPITAVGAFGLFFSCCSHSGFYFSFIADKIGAPRYSLCTLKIWSAVSRCECRDWKISAPRNVEMSAEEPRRPLKKVKKKSLKSGVWYLKTRRVNSAGTELTLINLVFGFSVCINIR